MFFVTYYRPDSAQLPKPSVLNDCHQFIFILYKKTVDELFFDQRNDKDGDEFYTECSFLLSLNEPNNVASFLTKLLLFTRTDSHRFDHSILRCKFFNESYAY